MVFSVLPASLLSLVMNGAGRWSCSGCAIDRLMSLDAMPFRVEAIDVPACLQPLLGLPICEGRKMSSDSQCLVYNAEEAPTVNRR